MKLHKKMALPKPLSDAVGGVALIRGIAVGRGKTGKASVRSLLGAGVCLILLSAQVCGADVEGETQWKHGPAEHIRSVLDGTAPGTEAASPQEALDAKYAAVIGLAVLGEADLLQKTATDPSQNAVIRLVAACSLARIGEEERGLPLAALAVRNLLAAVRNGDAVIPERVFGLFDYAVTSFSQDGLSPMLADIACDPSIPPIWRLRAGVASAEASGNWDSLVARLVSAQDDVNDEETALRDRQARGLICAAFLMNHARHSEEAERSALESLEVLDAVWRSAIYTFLAYRHLSQESAEFLRKRFDSVGLDDKVERARIAGILLTQTGCTDEALEAFIRDVFERQPEEVLGYVPMCGELGLELVKRAVANADDVCLRAAAYRKAAELLGNGACSFADVRGYFQQAADEPLLIPLQLNLGDPEHEDAAEVTRFLLSSGNSGLRQTGIMRNMRYSPGDNAALLRGILSERKEDSIVRVLALYSVRHVFEPSEVRLAAKDIFAYAGSYYDLSAALRVLVTTGGFGGDEGVMSDAMKRIYVSCIGSRRDPWGLLDNFVPDTCGRSIRAYCAYAPYRDFRQMAAWEMSIAEGLEVSSQACAARDMNVPAPDTQSDGLRAFELSLGSPNGDAAPLSYYGRTCLEMMRWLAGKDASECVKRLDRVCPFPLFAYRDQFGELETVIDGATGKP